MYTVFLLVLAGAALAAPALHSTHVLHEKRAAEPRGWTLTRRLESGKILPMRFGLVQQNLHKIEDMLMLASLPSSPKYGKHFTPQEIVDTFAPSRETISAVTDWLVEAGLAPERLRLSQNKAWIYVNATMSEVESLLKAEYHLYSHSSGAEQIGCHNYSVPIHVQKHIDLIMPTVHFNHRPAPNIDKRAGRLGQPSPRNGPKHLDFDAAIVPSLANCNKVITLDCLRALYNINYAPVATDKNTFGIVEFTPQAYLPGDLDMFFRNFSPSLVGVRPETVLIDGAVAVVQDTERGFDFNGESDLDLQYAMGLVNPQPVTLLQTGELSQGAGFDNWLDAVDGPFCTFDGGDDPTQDGIYPDAAGSPQSCGIVPPPNVVSISYGQDEATASVKYATRQCQEYAKLGMMGTTVVYSSGDNDVAGFDNICLDADHNETDITTGVFNPEFPSSCPFVTAVGATQVNPGATVSDPESACMQVIFSGGGFSNIFLMPSYQANAVNAYIDAHLTPSPFAPGQFNNSGNARGFPDVAANGANYIVAVNGQFDLVFGTSASAPVFGSIITLINDARIAMGKGPVGFINPIIYDPVFAPAFNDITTGTNPGCNTTGFSTTKGWDPVTGVGTPNFERLLNIFKDLP